MKTKAKIFIADDFHPDGIAILKKKFTVVVLKNNDNKKLLHYLSGPTRNIQRKSVLVIRSTRKIDKDFAMQLAALTDIKLICTVSSGFDNVDIKACKQFGIKVINVFDGNSVSAAEFTFSMILNAAKNIPAYNYKMKKGIFENTKNVNIELMGKTLGIIGVGRIGSRVAKYAKSFGMKVIGNDINSSLKNKYKWIKFVSLNSLLGTSNIITLHTPLDSSTYHLINKSNIKLVGDNSILINCARGGIIDEAALLDRLKKGKLYFAGLDVFEKEPAFNKQFTKLSNAILTPHIAGKTKESKRKMGVIAAENIIKNLK